MEDESTRALLRANLLAERHAAELRRRARGLQVRRLPLPRNGSDRPVAPSAVPSPWSSTRPDGSGPAAG